MRRFVVVLGLVGGVVLTGAGAMPCQVLPVQPRCDVVLHPGPIVDTLGALEVRGARTYSSTGQLLLTTVSVDTTVGWSEWWEAIVSGDSDRMPRSAVFPPGEDEEEVRQRNVEAMHDSQDVAVAAALRTLSLDAADVDVDIDTGMIGGPSAGLMLALGVVELLSEDDLTGGAVIAGTGAIDASGRVAAIGGVRQKVRAVTARDDRPASVFLVPADNLEEARSAPVTGRLLLVPVRDIGDAITALGTLREGGVPFGAVALGGAG